MCVLIFFDVNSCATCSQDHFNCPGHYGHIEVPIPAYNPMFFDNLYAILRSKCVYCHHFRISRAVVKRQWMRIVYIRKMLIFFFGFVDEKIDSTIKFIATWFSS